MLLEDHLHAGGINLHIPTGICARDYRPDGATIADKMLFMVAAMAAEIFPSSMSPPAASSDMHCPTAAATSRWHNRALAACRIAAGQDR